jgi:hypothetical protein
MNRLNINNIEALKMIIDIQFGWTPSPSAALITVCSLIVISEFSVETIFFIVLAAPYVLIIASGWSG